MLWHGSFAINSLSHLQSAGAAIRTGDDSRNNLALAIITTGEGWHNNHHHYQSSARQGFRWWEIDVTYYVLRLFERCGLVWDLRRSPAEVLRVPRRRAARTPRSPRRPERPLLCSDLIDAPARSQFMECFPPAYPIDLAGGSGPGTMEGALVCAHAGTIPMTVSRGTPSRWSAGAWFERQIV